MPSQQLFTVRLSMSGGIADTFTVKARSSCAAILVAMRAVGDEPARVSAKPATAKLEARRADRR